jgi:hypothetical protein
MALLAGISGTIRTYRLIDPLYFQINEMAKLRLETARAMDKAAAAQKP